MSHRLWGVLVIAAIVATWLFAKDCHDTHEVNAELRLADSAAAVTRQLAHQAHARAEHEHADAVRETVRGDSLEARGLAIAATARQGARGAMHLVALYDSARSLATSDSAMHLADSLRQAVPPLIAGYERTIFVKDSTIVSRDSSLAKQTRENADNRLAYTAQLETDSVTLRELALLKQERAPRCSTRCGTVIGVVSTLLTIHFITH
jgi:hypothetical protein